MDNRRNFYRILRVQPDASQDVIRHSYRSLMQKLKMHPDLGGEHWDAGIVNQAYTTLRDPKRRAAYDLELLTRYNIKTLASGGVIGDGAGGFSGAGSGPLPINQRNYYRILHVQPDAELEVVSASFRALSGLTTGEDLELLEQAFSIISDSALRSQYDALLRSHSHATSVEIMRRSEKEAAAEPEPGDALQRVESADERIEISAASLYRPSIYHYCAFCKTPCSRDEIMEPEHFCRECGSPLSSPADFFLNAPRRSLARMQQSASARVFEYWPGSAMTVSLEDLSPVGVNFSTDKSFDIDQVIKVDGKEFKAVAKVAHVRPAHDESRVGARFLTVDFMRTTGSFLSTSV